MGNKSEDSKKLTGVPLFDVFILLFDAIKDLKKKKDRSKEGEIKKLKKELEYVNFGYGVVLLSAVKSVLYFMENMTDKGIFAAVAAVGVFLLITYEKRKLTKQLIALK